IIAYNQHVTRFMVDEIRGISSSHMIRKLVYKNLICEVGRSETAGRPILYGTTSLFLDYFGLEDIKNLPQLQIEENDEVKELYNSKYKEEI
ncbi:MAG: SMC-Scp complex subunit ScpB, partial [Bacilli bacterium]|nr:SMC-Scp complex subunit ScpB [Bacilli bacterium]